MTTGALTIPAAEQLLEKISGSEWTPRVINIGALVLLTYSLAQWTWHIAGSDAPAPATVMRPTVTATSETALRDVLAANLFGQAAATQVSSTNLPATALNLVLTGVMVRGENSFALLGVDGAPEAPFGIGQDVTAGAKLHAVYADRIVLRRGGALETLMLKEGDAKLAPGSIVSGTGATPPSGQSVVRNQGPNSFAVAREGLNRQMQTPDFLSQALMVPNAGGGFLVRQIQPGSLYERLGLHVGDVIRSVNGQPINNVDEVMRLYQQLGGLDNVGQLAVEVSRAGKPETLNYQLQ
jgi:general secretion pathway protein C